MTLYDPWTSKAPLPSSRPPEKRNRSSRWHAALIWGHVGILAAFAFYLFVVR